MSEKKNYGRFCIRFNAKDTRHLRVIGLLEGHGRRKAQFITEAVLFYIDGESQANTAGIDSALLKNLISTIVQESLEKETTDNGTASLIEEHISVETIQTSTLDTNDIDSDLLAAVHASIESFRT